MRNIAALVSTANATSARQTLENHPSIAAQCTAMKINCTQSAVLASLLGHVPRKCMVMTSLIPSVSMAPRTVGGTSVNERWKVRGILAQAVRLDIPQMQLVGSGKITTYFTSPPLFNSQ